MIEVLPLRVLTDEDAPVFGALPVALAGLLRAGMPVADSIVITAPHLKLKTTLEHYDFGAREVFTQSLELVKKEIEKIPVPENLLKEAGREKHFFVSGQKIKSVKALWKKLLEIWLDEIKARLWNSGFHSGITEDLRAQVVAFIKKEQAWGRGYYDEFSEKEEVIVKSGRLKEEQILKIRELIKQGNKKLFLPYEYEWILEGGIKLTQVFPQPHPLASPKMHTMTTCLPAQPCKQEEIRKKSAVKVFFDLSSGFTIEKDIDGIYIASEKIYDLNKPQSSFDEMLFKLVDCAVTFPNSPVYFKLADKSEGMGKVRGTLRLLHQKSLLDPMLTALDFARHKKNLGNVHVVIPYVRCVNELLQIKRELAVKKLMRKNSLQIWVEMCVPENIVNIEHYLIAGIDGVVLNLDELSAHIGGYDPQEAEMVFYRNEADALLKFLEDAIKLMHKSKIPFTAYGSLCFYPKVLEYLVEKGVYGIVAERYDVHCAYDLLRQTEKRIVLRRA